MKNLSIILFLLILIGCEKDYDNVVDPINNQTTYQILEIDVPDSVYIEENNFDINLTINHFENQIKEVRVELITPNLTEIEYELELTSELNGIGTYSKTISIDQSWITGKFKSNFVVIDMNDDLSLVGIKYFYLKTDFVNTAPVVSNLNLPTSVPKDSIFTFWITATDENGSSDIQKVFYKLYYPDGTLVENGSGITEFPMSDTGDTEESGDLVANDSVYTMRLTFPTTVPTGTWTFEFLARDNSSAESNIIEQTIEVTE